MDREAWPFTVHGVAKNQTPLSNQAHTCMKPQTLNLYSISIERKPLGFPGGSDGKESSCNAGDSSSIPGLGRYAEEGIGYPLHYSWASLVGQMVKKSAHNAGDLGLIPGMGTPPGEGNSYTL